MNSEFEISVIIPTAARPRLTGDAIRSVLESTRPAHEIIVAIDSVGEQRRLDEDAVREACAGASTGLVILHTDAAGPAAARNAGISRARGNWIAFLDSDDLWQPRKLQEQVDYLARRPHLRACQTLEEWRKDGRLLTQPGRLRPRAGRFLRASFHGCLISPSSVMLHRECFDELGLFDESFPACEDFEFWLRYLIRSPMGLVPRALTVKRSGDWSQRSRDIPSLDAWRIRAVLKTALEHGGGELSPDEWREARAACEHKLGILERGMDKYGSEAMVEELRARIREVFSS